MLEPFLMLTVLNCFFMFSSTLTTCALWWQYRRHRHSCSSHSNEASKLKVKKSRSCEDRSLRDGKKNYVGDIIGLVGSKSSVKRRGKSTSRTAKESKKDKKSSGVSTRPRSKEAKNQNVNFLEKLTSTEDTRHGPTSPSSEAKSTVVMEVSTVQKVVQIFDNDRDHQQGRLPNETMTYRFSPENQRKVEFVVKSKSEDRSRSMEIVNDACHDV